MDHSNTSLVFEESIELCFASLNASCLKVTYPNAVRISAYLFLSFLVLTSIIGNLLVILAVVHFRQLHTPTNYLILSLAVSDLLLGLIVMPASMIRTVESCWYYGNWFCKFTFGTGITCVTASILNLALISIDRHCAICQPLTYNSRITGRITVTMASLTWVVSLTLGYGMIFLELNIKGIEEFYNSIACTGSCFLLQNPVSGTASSLLSFYIPGMIMICIYLNIYIIAQKQAQTMQSKHSKKASKTERKATKTLAIVLGVFVACWLPFFIINFTNPLIGYSVPPFLIDIAIWFGFFNSACNPFVYALFYKWFRKAFRIILVGDIFQKDSSKIDLFSD